MIIFQRLAYCIFLICILHSCSSERKPQLAETNYWESLKDSFATKNLESFVVDSQLQSSYNNFHRAKNRLIDSVIGYGSPSYLYSWQKSDSGFNAFTTFVDDGELGKRIIYFIFDSKDRLRSATQVAYLGGEGGIRYETRSRFIEKNTLYKTIAATTQWDFSLADPWSHPLSKSKGDSIFYQLIVLKDGRVIENKLSEKKELNLE